MYKKIALGLLALATVIAVGTYTACMIFYPGDRSPRKIGNKIEGEETFSAAGKINIAVLGVDKRVDDVGRSDTLFVIMYDPKTEKVSMLSIPRDTRVRFPDGGWDKINHAFAYGGVHNTVATVENLLGINIDYFVEVDFKGFEKLVDAIGGIELDVEKRMYYEDPYDADGGLIIDLQPGYQRLDGKSAIHYVRYRDEEGDIGRVKRQQVFIDAVYKKMSSSSMFTKLPELVKVAYDSVTTNMDTFDMLKIARTLNKNTRSGLNTFSVPGEPVFIEGISYWIPDIVSLRSEVADVVGLSSNDRYMASAQRLASSYEQSLPEFAEEVKQEKDGKLIASGNKVNIKEKIKEISKDNAEKAKKADKPDSKKVDEAKTDVKQQEAKDTTKEKTIEPQNKVLRASVINCSGDPSAGKKMETILERNGISVVSIFNGNTQQNSSIVASNSDSWVISRLAGLPFTYSLKINKGAASVDATVYVGKDFL